MKKNIFGTDGIRSHVGTGLLTSQGLIQIGHAIGTWALQRYGGTPSLLLASDTRISCDYIKHTLLSSLLSYPVEVHDAGVLPTPAAHLVAQKSGFDFALIISASHNGYQDNGIKIIDSKIGKLDTSDEMLLSELIMRDTDHSIDYNAFGTVSAMPHAHTVYHARVTECFKPDMLRGITVVLDTANGATSHIAPDLFRSFGAEVTVINNQPNGKNINAACGAVYPEQLPKTVTAVQADIGFAFDGDGDRLVVVTQSGELKNGDQIVAEIMLHPAYAQESVVVGTVMSNYGFEQFLHTQNKQLIRTQVGDKYVTQALVSHHALIGGETSGHIIIRNYLSTGDGIFAALTLLEALTITGNWDLNSCALYPQILLNIPVKAKKDLETDIIKESLVHHNQHLIQGRMLVRYSGTEDLLRVMVEASDHEHATLIASNIAADMQRIINQ